MKEYIYPKTKVLGVFSLAFLPNGGAQISTIQNWLNIVKIDPSIKFEITSFDLSNKKKYILGCLSQLEYKVKINNEKIIYSCEGITINIILSKDINESFNKFIKHFLKQKPDVLYGFFVEPFILRIKKMYPKIKTIFFINTAEYIKKSKKIPKDYLEIINESYLTVASNFMKNKFKEDWQLEPILLLNNIESKQCFSEKNKKEYITLINPNKEKGIDIFLELAEKLKEKKFLIVKNWHNKKLNLSHNLSNLIVIDNQREMKNVYEKTKVLIVPSIWEEAFGRVIIEAFINGIPVIASDKGGIPETLSDSGFSFEVIKDKAKNINEWIDKIKELENKEYYQKISLNCKKTAESYILKMLINQKVFIKKIKVFNYE